MPLKYFAGYPQAVLIVGWMHGFLFIVYIISAFDVKIVKKWSVQKSMMALVASLVPLGPFILDKKILSKEIE
jgi:integral membrane protein